MSTLVSSIISDVRKRTSNPTTNQFADLDVIRFIDAGQKDIVSKTYCLEDIQGIVAVQGQPMYSLPTDFLGERFVLWQEDRIIMRTFVRQFAAGANIKGATTGTPLEYLIYKRPFNRIRLIDAPASNGITTTLSSLLASNATIITVASTASFFAAGRIQIESEQMDFSTKSGTQFLNVIRGVGGTTAASHANGTTVTQVDIKVGYFKSPATLTASTDVIEIPDVYTELLSLYAAHIMFYKEGNETVATNLYQEYLRKLEQMYRNIEGSAYERTFPTIDVDYWGETAWR